ncbi:MAG: SufE family protein [Muribaculaceae bacterium]|nr:SufE family protein [Muribaculaceae bacterium]
MTINETQQEIIEEFEGLTDWMDRYAYIIDLGNTLPEFPENEKTPANLIEGCQSRVWIHADRDADGIIKFEADSDALIVKGIVALLLRVLSGHTAKEIAEADLTFIDAIGLGEHLSPTRSNGLRAMVKEMKNYAKAYMMIDNGADK